jgi:CDP-L-myo-inositol myo-inositolphosphotransferase
MRLLANTAVTPNQITVVCNLLAYGVAALLATGHLLAGAVGAMIVGVIDGLDGRQARVQLRTSRLGRLEHLLDKIYEVLWIVALAWSLSGHFADRRTVVLLIVWIAAYLADTAAYDVVKWRTGATLDEASRLDAAIRAVAGRRNIYACMLLAGSLLGAPDEAFVAIVGWAVITALVHALRAVVVISGRRRRVLV